MQVKWDVWAGIDESATPDLLRSREATRKRILLEGPFCRQWYLGERVVRQSLGYKSFRVPKPIPHSMLSTNTLTVEDLGKWTQGEDATVFLEETGDYSEYRALRAHACLRSWWRSKRSSSETAGWSCIGASFQEFRRCEVAQTSSTGGIHKQLRSYGVPRTP